MSKVNLHGSQGFKITKTNGLINAKGLIILVANKEHPREGLCFENAA